MCIDYIYKEHVYSSWHTCHFSSWSSSACRMIECEKLLFLGGRVIDSRYSVFLKEFFLKNEQTTKIRKIDHHGPPSCKENYLSATSHISCIVACCLSHGMCLYQVMMMLHLLNDIANDAESTQK